MQRILPSSKCICVGLFIVLIVAFTDGLTTAIETFHMNRKCGETINMVWKSIYTARIQHDYTALGDPATHDVAPGNTPQQYAGSSPMEQSCDIGIQSWNFQDRIMLYFSDISMDANCSDVHLEILDGPSIQSRPVAGLPRSICGGAAHLLQSPLVTSGRYLTIRLHGDDFMRRRTTFTIVVVSFHEGTCQSFEHACSSGRCIMSELICNGFNPCGDQSDCISERALQQVAPEEGHVVIVVIVTIGTLIAVCVVGVIAFSKCYNVRRKHTRRSYLEAQTTSDIEAAGAPHAVATTQSEIESERLHSPPSYNSLRRAEEEEVSDGTSSNCSCTEPTNPLPPSYSCVMTHQDMFHLSMTSLHKAKGCAENAEPT